MVGITDGFRVGEMVGLDDGLVEGLVVGFLDGFHVGGLVGLVDGLLEGLRLGLVERNVVGLFVGYRVEISINASSILIIADVSGT